MVGVPKIKRKNKDITAIKNIEHNALLKLATNK